jgi:hypothetical protein
MAKRAALLLILAVVVLPAHADAQEARWWKGNLHTHSLWTDGTEFPEMIAAWYREHGYNFVAFTEHDMLQQGERWVDINAPDPGWPPRNASTRAALPLYREKYGDWVQERREGERHLVRLRALDEYRHMYERPGEFLLLNAEEITDRGGAHVNAFQLAQPILPRGGETTAQRTTANLAAVREQRAQTGRRIVAIINHPNYVWSLTAQEIAAMDDARFFELYNGHKLTNVRGDSTHPGTEEMWDVMLTLRHAAGRAPVFAVATDDAHDFRATADTISRPGRGWVMIRARSLAPDSLFAALEAGDFYASTGVTLRDVAARADRLRIEIDPAAGATYRTYFIGTRRGATAAQGTAVGEVFAVVEGASAEYRLRGDERFVRARVVSSLPHIDPTTGRVLGQQTAWVQPLFR